MALRQVRIGSLPDVYQYDDGDFSTAIETDQPIEIGASSAGAEAVRQDQLPSIADIVFSDTDLTDNAVVRGDGGGKEIQESAVYIDDSGNITIPDAGYIGSASDTDAIQIASTGAVTFASNSGHPITAKTSARYAGIRLLDSSDNNLFQVYPNDADLGGTILSVYDAGLEKIRLDTDGVSYFNGGSVGFLESSPSYPVHMKAPAGYGSDTTEHQLMLQSDESENAFIAFMGDGTGTTFFAGRRDAGNNNQFTIGRAGTSYDIIVAGNGRVSIPDAYSNDMSGDTMREVQVNSSGELGYDSVLQRVSGTKVLSDGVATGFVDITVGSGELVGGQIQYAIYVDNGSDLQAHMGGIGFVAVNKAGTVTSDIKETYVPATEVEVVTAGTLTDTFTVTDGAGKITINCNANTSLAGATITIHYTIFMHSSNVITRL